jgi:hypothetical protein
VVPITIYAKCCETVRLEEKKIMLQPLEADPCDRSGRYVQPQVKQRVPRVFDIKKRRSRCAGSILQSDYNHSRLGDVRQKILARKLTDLGRPSTGRVFVRSPLRLAQRRNPLRRCLHDRGGPDFASGTAKGRGIHNVNVRRFAFSVNYTCRPRRPSDGRSTDRVAPLSFDSLVGVVCRKKDAEKETRGWGGQVASAFKLSRFEFWPRPRSEAGRAGAFNRLLS